MMSLRLTAPSSSPGRPTNVVDPTPRDFISSSPQPTWWTPHHVILSPLLPDLVLSIRFLSALSSSPSLFFSESTSYELSNFFFKLDLVAPASPTPALRTSLRPSCLGSAAATCHLLPSAPRSSAPPPRGRPPHRQGRQAEQAPGGFDGHSVFPAAKEAGHLTPASVRFDGVLAQPSTVAAGRSSAQYQRWQAQTLRRASSYVGADHDGATAAAGPEPAPFKPPTLDFLRSLLDRSSCSVSSALAPALEA
ncbi:uncharacterized protein LOC120654941 [Panicum virgatum]|uniref:uncharacterized protein LOC120654941 n=1 Tax=Panicum virgatum TaxID=38727 RepID=UPI0019D5DDBC|nr:uncharacterized protein LOC120654941 [Panicum virgatum]